MKYLKWTVEISVAESWVTDGFDLSQKEYKLALLANYLLPYAGVGEIKVRVVKKPRKVRMEKLQR